MDPPQDSKLDRRHSKALSISSLSNESDTNAKALAKEACRDVERELAALETRLRLFQEQRRHHNTNQSTVSPLKSKIKGAYPDQSEQRASVLALSSVSSNGTNLSSSNFSTLSKAQQEAEAVADQVATTLSKCDQLLLRARSCDTSCVSSVNSIEDCSQSESHVKKASSSSHLKLNGGSPFVLDVRKSLASEDEEAVLDRKVAAVKRFAAHCQRDIEKSSRKITLHQQQRQAAYLKELQRKYHSRKQMALMNFREKYEKETKALVKAKMEEYEIEEATAVQTTRELLIKERYRTLEELQNSHHAHMEECVSELESQLIIKTEQDKQELSKKLQQELDSSLLQIQIDNDSFLKRWEVEQRQKLEQEVYENREAAVASALKTQEERTAVLKQEIQANHLKKEEVELEKLKKALAFGAQAQLQQLHKLLETEHSEKVLDIENEAALKLEKEVKELKQMLIRSHQSQQDQLKRELEKKTRVAIMELHDTMQVSQRESLQALKEEAEQRRAQAVAAHQQEFEQECRQELQTLEQTLQQEMTAKLRQLEMKHAEECELKLEHLRARALNLHARELEAKRSRMIQCKNVLLAEATTFLTLDNQLSDNDRSKSLLEESSAAVHLSELKKHLSKELIRYVDVMLTEFDELAEEHHILVTKISEVTQLYLSFKRQCEVHEARTCELSSGLETLNEQLQRKDAVCKKLYLANEELLKRLQIPVDKTSVATDETLL